MNSGQERTPKIIPLAGLLLASSAFFLPIINPDIFWHFSAARYMLEHGCVPRFDFLSWTMQGREWVDFEWLSQLIFYSLYRLGGVKLLVLFKGALMVAVTVVSWRTAGLSGRVRGAWLYMPVLAAGIMTNSDLRPENFSLLFFALILYALERGRIQGITRLSARTAVLTGVFFALWTNLHAGYLYGLALVFIYFIGGACRDALSLPRGVSERFKAAGRNAHLKYAAIGLGASLLNPYGYKIYGVILNHGEHMAALQEYIQEWKAFEPSNIYQAPYLMMLICVSALLVRRLIRGREILLEHFGVLVFFAWAGFRHARLIPFFILTALPYSVVMCGPGAAEKFKKYQIWALKILALAAILWYYNERIWSRYTGGSTQFVSYSEGLSEFLKSNSARLSGLRLFNHWGWGGFLGYALYPGYKVFIDGRYIFHDKLEESFSAGLNLDKWRAFVEKYKFDCMVIKPDESIIAVKQRLPGGREAVFRRPAYLFYLPKKDWAVVYWDLRSAVLVRRKAVSSDWLAERNTNISGRRTCQIWCSRWRRETCVFRTWKERYCIISEQTAALMRAAALQARRLTI